MDPVLTEPPTCDITQQTVFYTLITNFIFVLVHVLHTGSVSHNVRHELDFKIDQ